MTLTFDISQDELPIFLSEADEQLQILDEILVQLENLTSDEKALQTVFRAAHTLKGMSGMIGHTRMVKLTHSLETVLDGFRKGTLAISSELIDICLDAVDGLRLLRVEVVNGIESDFDFEGLLSRFEILDIADKQETPTASPAAAKEVVVAAPGAGAPGAGAQSGTQNGAPQNGAAQKEVEGNSSTHLFEIKAAIAPDSIASAARAFQLLMALQELGSIQEMEPSQEQIETACPVKSFYAKLSTGHSQAEVQRALSFISEVNELTVNGWMQKQNEATAPDVSSLPKQQPEAQKAPQAGLAVEAPKRNGRPLGSESQPGAGRKNNNGSADTMVRTSVERLDALMDLVGELITDRNHLSQMRTQFTRDRVGEAQYDHLAETTAHISRITDQLQEQVMRIRMQPVANVFNKFPRLVRDLAQKTGKKIDLIIRGEDTELDRSVIEEINDPLIHLLRNSVDHGIELPEERIAAGKPERGKIYLTARHEQGRIVLTVEDDGHGINVERLKKSAIARGLLPEEEVRSMPDDKALELVFLSGLSTSAGVTDISGRGVGMDIVRSNIQKIKGNILVETKPGSGTQFQIILPLTLAIIPTLLVRVSSITFAIPIIMVAETLRLTGGDIKTIRGKPVTLLRDKVLPLVQVRDVFHLEKDDQNQSYLYAVVVNHGKQQVGLVVDTLMGEEEVVVKSLGELVGNITGISSATILGDGSVALIVDVPGLLKISVAH